MFIPTSNAENDFVPGLASLVVGTTIQGREIVCAEVAWFWERRRPTTEFSYGKREPRAGKRIEDEKYATIVRFDGDLQCCGDCRRR